MGWVLTATMFLVGFHGSCRFLGDPSGTDTRVETKTSAWAVPPPPRPHPNDDFQSQQFYTLDYCVRFHSDKGVDFGKIYKDHLTRSFEPQPLRRVCS